MKKYLKKLTIRFYSIKDRNFNKNHKPTFINTGINFEKIHDIHDKLTIN